LKELDQAIPWAYLWFWDYWWLFLYWFWERSFQIW